jgi:hypothetical protein
MNMLKSSKAFITIDKITAKINLAWEIARLNTKKVNLTRLSSLVDEFSIPYGAKTNDILKRSYVLANDYGINEERLVHLIYGEWRGNWSLDKWLHSMKRVENLLRDSKIIVRTKTMNNWANWEQVNYEKYVTLSEANRKVVRIWWNDQNKTLFPRIWTDDDITIALKQANDLLKTWNNWNLVKILDETTFIKYCIEWWVYNPQSDIYENLLQKFKDWWDILFSQFWANFSRNIFSYNGIDINIWSKYKNRILIEETTTLFPK